MIFLRKYIQAVVQHKYIVLFLTVGMTLLMLYGVTILKVENNPDLWVPQNNPLIISTHKISKDFGGRHVVVIGLLPQDGNLQSKAVQAAAERIRQQLLKLPGVIESNVLSITADKVKDIRGTEQGMEIKRFAEVADFKAAVLRNSTLQGTLVSQDFRALAISADFKLEGVYKPLYLDISKIIEQEQTPQLKIVVGGEPIESAQLELAMDNMPIYFGLAFVIIMLVQLVAFRSLQGMLLPMLTAVLSIIWGLGIYAMLGQSMDALNSVTPILIVSVASGHAIQLLKRYYDELGVVLQQQPEISLKDANTQAIIESLVKVGPVLLIAGVIVSMAFFSFLFSDIEILRKFGLLAGISVLCILVIEFTFTPALRMLLPARRISSSDRKSALDRFLISLGRMFTNRRASLLVSVVVVAGIVLLSLGVPRLNMTSSFKEYNSPHSKVRLDGDVLNHAFAGINTFSILIEGKPDDMKDVAVLQGIAKLQAHADQYPQIGKTVSIVNFITRMNSAMHNDAKAYDVIPLTKEAVAQYFLLYSMNGDGNDFDNVVNQDYSKAVIWVYSRQDNTADAVKLQQQLAQLAKTALPRGINVEFGGDLLENAAMNDSIVKSKLSSLMQMGVIIFVLTALYFRSLAAGLMVCTPLVIVVICNLGLMGWLGIPLDMGAATVTSLVAGLGADYEIYMLSRLREEYRKSHSLVDALNASLQTAGKAVIYVTCSIAAGYSALLFADYQFYPRLGLTMILTALISCILSIVFLRALIVLMKLKFITQE